MTLVNGMLIAGIKQDIDVNALAHAMLEAHFCELLASGASSSATPTVPDVSRHGLPSAVSPQSNRYPLIRRGFRHQNQLVASLVQGLRLEG